jgi:GxxExxY protein
MNRAVASIHESLIKQMDITDLHKINDLIEMFQEVAGALKKGRTETVYQNAITVELQERGIQYTEEETMPIYYKGKFVGQERLDIVLHTWLQIIIELKATTTDIKSDNLWQVISYMRYKKYKYGVVVNYTQSPSKDLMYSVVLLQEDRPYVYDLETDALTELTDYTY